MKIDSGRVIAYGGGSGITAVSSSAKAADIGITPTPGDVMTLLNAPLVQFGGVQVVVADIVSIAGVVLVLARLSFDVWKYIDMRRQVRRQGGQNEIQ
ncbi:hypothetical protein GCM10010082_31590 [Kushneria pakistanensis]|uniref:Holin n=1 Tax=Kushneria pakistanensis TaxID=1508770 RepID=A0ABQ3FRF1_9GAMM|nr:hypothetical protein [Kushneria pakistanensis]GHC34591.1 hypothetical protein GCM10010082_31590 [Kushneria pakistanensis]